MTRQSILLVDDDEVFRRRLTRAFEERGYDTRSAADYEDAVAQARHDSPELAVVDLRTERLVLPAVADGHYVEVAEGHD